MGQCSYLIGFFIGITCCCVAFTVKRPQAEEQRVVTVRPSSPSAISTPGGAAPTPAGRRSNCSRRTSLICDDGAPPSVHRTSLHTTCPACTKGPCDMIYLLFKKKKTKVKDRFSINLLRHLVLIIVLELLLLRLLIHLCTIPNNMYICMYSSHHLLYCYS